MKIFVLAGLLIGFPLAGFCLDAATSYSLTPVHEQRLDLSLEHTQLAAAREGNALTPSSPLILSIPEEPDWKGLLQDSELFLLYQVAVVGAIYFMPESISQWDEEAKGGNPLKKWDNNVSDLRRDTDKWGINYIMHPYFGGTYYVRARNRGVSRNGSFWYAVTMSTLYEYGIEAVFESPSVQDLIFTPVAGAVVGEYFMIGRQKIINKIAETDEQTGWDTFRLFLTDPIGVINKRVVESFGRQYDAQLELQPIIAPSFLRNHATTSHPHQHTTLYGLQAQLSW